MTFLKKLLTEDENNIDNTIDNDFTELELPEELLKAIADLQFTSCTPVQKEVLPHSIDGSDIIAQAQTGTGKTAAFLISMITYHLENVEITPRKPGTPFALIIAPTRELVMQITSDAEGLSAYTDITTVSIVGGMDYEKQKKRMQSSVDIVVATPGRLLDFCRSNIIDLSHVESLVIDEADRMLSMGFIPDVKSIVSRTPKKDRRQTQLFSATFSEDIRRLSVSWTLDPVNIDIEPEQVAVDSVTQLVYLTTEADKFKALYNLLKIQDVQRAIIFVNRRDQTRDLEEMLYRHGITTGLLTGEVPQKKRIKTLDQFKRGEIEILVATDVAGRGIHVDDISHVINYNLPEDPEDYIHRIGRTGRAGALGTSISLVCESDVFMLPAIETLLGDPIVSLQPEDQYLEELPDPVRKKRVSSAPPKRKYPRGR
ncbi:MAG: DEAD/DEAH box helicase [Pseudomonadales bacterium]|nr:DEAD/DEAH box helicase [Pseudomonadales bacterium]